MKIYSLLGCPCYPLVSEDEAGQLLTKLVNSAKGGYSVAINAEKITRFNKDLELNQIISSSTLCYPDGAGAVIAFKWLYGLPTQKINFPIVSLKTAEKEQWPVFILGAKEEVNLLAFQKIKQLFPNIKMSGRANGYLTDDEKIGFIKNSNAKLVLIAMGTPKQEIFARRLIEEHEGLFCVGCGGALDILAGQLNRAPDFMVNNNFEWLYRLYKEPFRWRRQLILPVFLLKTIKAAFAIRMSG